MHDLVSIAALLLLSCGFFVLLATRFGLPPLIGYLAVGILLGPSVSGWIQQGESLSFLSEVGVILLLFMVGLEFSLSEFWNIKKHVLKAGTLQLLLIGFPVALFVILGQIEEAKAAVLLGFAVAVSSTALVAKQLSEQGELLTPYGRACVAVLIFQDLATIPILTLISVWVEGGESTALGVTVKVFGVLALFLVASIAGKLCLHRLLAWVARRGNEENFVLVSLAIVMAAAAGAHALGVSAALGAFLTGMVLGESDFKHRMEEHLTPFRHVFSGLFFVTIGLQLDFHILSTMAGSVLLWLLVLIPLKSITNLIAFRCSGLEKLNALKGSLVLAHGGEFGLLILSLAMQKDIVEASVAQPLLGALVLSMAVAPLLMKYHHSIAACLQRNEVARSERSDAENEMAKVSDSLENHVVICGSGRLGIIVSQTLMREGIDHLLIESDYDAYQAAREKKMPVYFGDASRESTLEAAGISDAGFVVITFSEEQRTLRTVNWVRHHNPDCKIIAVAQTCEGAQRLKQKLAIEVYAEELATGLALAKQALMQTTGIPAVEADEKIQQMNEDSIA